MAESSTYQGKFYECRDEASRCLKKLEEDREVFVSELRERREAFFEKIQKLAKTGDLNAAGFGSVSKEANNESDQENVPVKRGRGRKKNILTESTDTNLQDVKVKKEKISIGSDTARSSVASTMSGISEIPVDAIKTEQTDMAAPTWIPPKKKGKETKSERASVRSTRTKGKKGNVRDSDVVVQNTRITTINLSDTEDFDGEKAQTKDSKTRSTRTKTKKVKGDGDSGTETDTDSTRSTRTKTRNKNYRESLESDEPEPTRTTRTKTIKKGKKIEQDPEEPPQEIRSTRTRPIKKEEESRKDQPEESPQEIRSTRTRTTKKVAELLDKTDEDIDDSEEETTTATTRTTRASKEKDNERIGEGTSDVQKSNDVPKPSKQGKAKRHRSSSNSDDQANSKKRSKSISPVQDVEENANTTTKTVYEDARSTVGAPQDTNQQHLNSTYVAEAPAASASNRKTHVPALNATITIKSAASTTNVANSTMVVDKPHFTLFDKNSIEGMLTDDDSIEFKKTPPKKASSSKASKEVFSPYEKTTLKKKVEAFEKLQNGSDIPVRTTASVRSHNTPSAVREKAKIFTPLGSKFMPGSSSTSKISRLISSHNVTSNDSLAAMKARSESVQKESRDRQKKQLEREQALKKKEAMLLAQVEAKKKLNEEKHLKAQQQRKLLEAEKLKQLEAQKQKEARLKQREREREEYVQKQKLEMEKKRQEQKKKLAEMQAQRQQILEEQAKHPPIYMTTRPPRLPTEDCYDSDEPDYKKTVPPRWCSGEYTRRKQLTMLAAGEKIKNTLFCRHAQTPDLQEIFEVIDPRKLKRSSSVLWRKPPRYTMMPDLNETKFEEDDALYDSD